MSSPTSWSERAVAELAAAFEAAGDAERAAGMRRYMRDQFEFFGLPTPERRAIREATRHL